MFVAYVVVSILLAAYLAFSTWADFTRYNQVLIAMAGAGVPDSWLPCWAPSKVRVRWDCWSASACH